MKPYKPPKRTLNSAAEAGDIESIMFHLLAGSDINGRNANGFFPLGGAAHYGHAQAVHYLIQHGAKINMLTPLNWSPLYIAAWRGHLDVVKVLLAAGASTTPRTIFNDYGPSQHRYTALHGAASAGHTKIVRLLLKHGANPRARAGKHLPEDVAENAGHIGIARLLKAERLASTSKLQ